LIERKTKEVKEKEMQDKLKEVKLDYYDEKDPQIQIFSNETKSSIIYEVEKLIEKPKEEKIPSRPITAKKNFNFVNESDFSTIQKGVQTERIAIDDVGRNDSFVINKAEILFGRTTKNNSNYFNKAVTKPARPSTSRSKLLSLMKSENSIFLNKVKFK
jgi:hypothetical protein